MVSLSLLLFPACPDLLIEDITLESKTLIISVRSTKTSVQCPACARPSAKVHSRYVRVPADLPWIEYGVLLHLEVRRFFCQHEDCSRKTFAEPFPELRLLHRCPLPAHPFLACLVSMTGPGAKDAGTEPFSAIWSDRCRWICCRTATRTLW